MFLIAVACPARRCEAANVHKRYLSCGVQPRHSDARDVRIGNPEEAASTRSAILFVIQTDSTLAIAVISAIDGTAMLVIIIEPDAA